MPPKRKIGQHKDRGLTMRKYRKTPRKNTIAGHAAELPCPVTEPDMPVVPLTVENYEHEEPSNEMDASPSQSRSPSPVGSDDAHDELVDPPPSREVNPVTAAGDDHSLNDWPAVITMNQQTVLSESRPGGSSTSDFNYCVPALPALPYLGHDGRESAARVYAELRELTTTRPSYRDRSPVAGYNIHADDEEFKSEHNTAVESLRQTRNLDSARVSTDEFPASADLTRLSSGLQRLVSLHEQDERTAGTHLSFPDITPVLTDQAEFSLLRLFPEDYILPELSEDFVMDVLNNL